MDSAEYCVDRMMIAGAGFDLDAVNREAILNGHAIDGNRRYVVRRRGGYFSVWDQRNPGWASSPMSQPTADRLAAQFNRSAS